MIGWKIGGVIALSVAVVILLPFFIVWCWDISVVPVFHQQDLTYGEGFGFYGLLATVGSLFTFLAKKSEARQ
jgi:hypothetical protein